MRCSEISSFQVDDSVDGGFPFLLGEAGRRFLFAFVSRGQICRCSRPTRGPPGILSVGKTRLGSLEVKDIHKRWGQAVNSEEPRYVEPHPQSCLRSCFFFEEPCKARASSKNALFPCQSFIKGTPRVLVPSTIHDSALFL
jgi:hypothetical protein